MTGSVCIVVRNGAVLQMRSDVERNGGRAEEEEARLVTARVDLASPSVFRETIRPKRNTDRMRLHYPLEIPRLLIQACAFDVEDRR